MYCQFQGKAKLSRVHNISLIKHSKKVIIGILIEHEAINLKTLFELHTHGVPHAYIAFVCCSLIEACR